MSDNVSRADVVAAVEATDCRDDALDAIRALPAAPAAEACPTHLRPGVSVRVRPPDGAPFVTEIHEHGAPWHELCGCWYVMLANGADAAASDLQLLEPTVPTRGGESLEAANNFEEAGAHSDGPTPGNQPGAAPLPTPAPTVEAEEQAWDGDKSLRFTAVVFWNEVAWCAQLKEKDIASQGATVKEAFENLGWTIDADAKLHDGLARIAPCPGDVWREYARKAKRKRSRPIAHQSAPTVEVDYDIEAAEAVLNQRWRDYADGTISPATLVRAIVDAAIKPER